MRRSPRTARSAVPPVLAVLLLAATASACTDDGDGDVVGDPSACAGRVSAATLDAAFPGWDTTTGGFGTAEGDVGGCAVRREGRRLATVAVVWEPSEPARRQALERGRDTTDPPPSPAGLGPDVAAGDDGDASGGLVLLVGEYVVTVNVEDAADADAAVAASAALARDVQAWYAQRPTPAATPSAPA